MLANLYKTFDRSDCISTSKLWNIIKDYYRDHGETAWQHNIPFTVTNSTPCADYHAKLIINHFIQLNQPRNYTIIDYGAGIGQHGYLLIHALEKHCIQHQISLDCFTLVLADISPKTIAYWHKHEQLKPLINSNYIQTHCLSGSWLQDLEALCPKNTPCCLIANYLLDSMPFIAYENHIQQGLKLSAPRKFITPEFSGPITSITFKTTPSSRSLSSPLWKNRYAHLQRYTIPTVAIQFIQQYFSDPNRLMLINDKCFNSPNDIDYCTEFSLINEGCFSSTVNMDAILHTLPDSIYSLINNTSHKRLSTYVLSSSQFQIPPSINCSDSAILFHHFKQSTIPFDLMLPICITLKYDPFCLELFSQNINIQTASADQIKTVSTIIQSCLKNHFNKQKDFTHLHIAKLYRKLGNYTLSQTHLNEFIKHHDHHPAFHFEQGLLYKETRNELAKNHLEIAAQDPKLHSAASNLLKELNYTNNEY